MSDSDHRNPSGRRFQPENDLTNTFIFTQYNLWTKGRPLHLKTMYVSSFTDVLVGCYLWNPRFRDYPRSSSLYRVHNGLKITMFLRETYWWVLSLSRIPLDVRPRRSEMEEKKGIRLESFRYIRIIQRHCSESTYWNTTQGTRYWAFCDRWKAIIRRFGISVGKKKRLKVLRKSVNVNLSCTYILYCQSTKTNIKRTTWK